MSNISDYLDWRSDVSFELAPFNEVDNLILCQLGYVNWEGILPSDNFSKTITIESACKKYFSIYSEEEIISRQTMTKMAPFLLKKMINTNRYGKTKIGGFINTVDNDTQTQFSVVTFYLPDNTIFISFRGTDNTIVGWKEDFNMCFMSETAGQALALKYLNENFNNCKKRIRVGGHSKGGNFAVYASCFCKPNIRNKIIDVFSNDGPGFEDHILATKEYKQVLSKVHSTLPEFSVVGMLMENEYDNQYVISTNKGLMTHDLMSWQVLKDRFVLADNVAKDAILIDKTIKNWYKDVDFETRESFLDIFFSSLFNQSDVLSDITGQPIRTLAELKRTVDDLPEDEQKMFYDIIKKFVKSSSSVMVDTMAERISAMVKIPELPNLPQIGKIKREKKK